MAIIFIGLWVGLTLLILLPVVFTLLKPIFIADVTGISMIIIGLIIGTLRRSKPFFLLN